MTGEPLAEAPRVQADNASSANGAGFSKRYVWYAVFILWVVNIVNYMDRMALSVLLPDIKSDLSLSDSELGLLVGFAFSLFYSICGIPIARLADRAVRKNVIAIALAVWSAMTALSGAALNFWHLFLARVGVGAGEAGCLPPSQSLICDYVEPERRAGALSFHIFGLTVGMITGMALAGWLVDVIGWRWTFVALGLPGIALAVVVAFTLKEPTRGAFDSAEQRLQAPVSLRVAFAALWRLRTYRLLLIYYAIGGFAQYGLSQWLPSFYMRGFELDAAEVGWPLGLAIGAGTGIGLLIGGRAADRAAKAGKQRPLGMAALCTMLCFAAASAAVLVSSFVISLALIGLTMLLWSVAAGPVLGTLYGVTPPHMRATAGAIPVLFSSIFGFGLGPLAVGVVSDWSAASYGALSLQLGLMAPICAFLPTALVLLLTARSAVRDLPGGAR